MAPEFTHAPHQADLVKRRLRQFTSVLHLVLDQSFLVRLSVLDQSWQKIIKHSKWQLTNLMNRPENAPQQPASSAATELPFAVAFAALFMGAIAMGISPVFVRNAEVGPFASAFWRVALALPLLLAWATAEAKRQNKPLMATLIPNRAIVLTGLFFAADLFFWHLAIMNTSIANATLLACLAPLWVALLSGKFIGEKINRRVVIGLIICLLGAAMLIGTSYRLNPGNVLGDIYGVITSFFFGLYFLAVRVSRRTHSAGSMTFLSTVLTAAILLVVALLSGQSFVPDTLKGAGALAALGIISHAGGQGLLAVALGSLSAVFSSLVIFIEAIAAALFGWALLNEPLSIGQIAGGALILSGIWIARPGNPSQ